MNKFLFKSIIIRLLHRFYVKIVSLLLFLTNKLMNTYRKLVYSVHTECQKILKQPKILVN